ncbi:MAG: Eco57I restriction-modification methylase domain-containing protein [Thermogutta sp.]
MANRKFTTKQNLTSWLRRSKPTISALLADLVEAVHLQRRGKSSFSWELPLGTEIDEVLSRHWMAEWGFDQSGSFRRFHRGIASLYIWGVTAVTATGLSNWGVAGLPKSSETLAVELVRELLADTSGHRNSSSLGRLRDWLGVPELWARKPPKLEAFFRTLVEWSQAYFAEWNERENMAFDLFEPFHAMLFPKKVRLQIGEFYTPFWLAEHILEELHYPEAETSRLLDPTCGSGVFLAAAARRLIRRLFAARSPRKGMCGACGETDECHGADLREVAHQMVRRALGGQIVGVDVNRLAVIAARANLLLATIRSAVDLGPTVQIHLKEIVRDPPPIRWANFPRAFCDHHSVNGDNVSSQKNHPPRIDDELFQQDFQFLVGNPPWLLWDNLSQAARRQLIPLCQELGLFDLSSREARHGGAKRDFGVAMVWAATRLLAQGGKLGIILPASLLRGGKAGRSFRQLRVPPGIPLRVIQAEDLCGVSVFPGTIRRTVLFFAEKGSATIFPISYYVWQKTNQPKKTEGPTDLPMCRRRFLAQPSQTTDTTSSWSIMTEGSREISRRIMGPSAYNAYLGANTAGANGIFWLDIVGYQGGVPVVRNCPQCGRQTVPTYEGPIEGDLLYPLLRWQEVGERQTAGKVILLVQDPLSRKAIPEEILKCKYPLTYAYLCRFRELLEKRAACRKLQHNAAWYSQYNVGPYTLAADKVVWRRMDWEFAAVLVAPQALGKLGIKPVIPQETCCFIPVSATDEAAYLLAVLNSRLVRAMIHSSSLPGSRGFASPRILQCVGIPQYDSRLALHRQLAELGRRVHLKDRPLTGRSRQREYRNGAATTVNNSDKGRNVALWDHCLAELYGLSAKEYEKLCEIEELGP